MILSKNVSPGLMHSLEWVTLFALEISVNLSLITLSDCQGKMCYNGGNLDHDTCTCLCSAPYTADQCETGMSFFLLDI